MARRTRSNQSENTEAQEANVSTTVTEAEATEVQAPEATPEAAKPAEVEVDLTAFDEAVAAAVAEKDSATGEIALVFIDPVNKAYRELDGVKAKNKAKTSLNEKMKEAMNQMDIQTARAYLTLTEKLSAGGGTKTEKAPADPTEAFVQRYAGLRIALSLVSENVPEGVDDSWQDKAKAVFEAELDAAKSYLAYVTSDDENKGDEPEVSAVVKAAVKLSQGKAAKVGGRTSGGGGTFSGERRDIAKHIQSAFANVADGTFLTVAEIKNHTSEEYGDSSPSAGAISARLFPASGKSTVEGVEPGTNEKGHKGARKVA